MPDRFVPDAALIPLMAESERQRLGVAESPIKDRIAHLRARQAGCDIAAEFLDSAAAAVEAAAIEDEIGALCGCVPGHRMVEPQGRCADCDLTEQDVAELDPSRDAIPECKPKENVNARRPDIRHPGAPPLRRRQIPRE